MKRVALTTSNSTKADPYIAALEPHFVVERLLPGDARAATEFDGIVLAGGADVNPRMYGETAGPETEDADDARDAMERRLIAEALDADIPIFAICRGVQMLNVATGGKLVQHLPTADVHSCRGVVDAHEANVEANTRLAAITGVRRLVVNSRHHQAVSPDDLGAGLVVTATRPEDGVVEAVEMPGRAFVVGVQWHPEDSVAVRESDRRLFAAFAQAVNG